MNKMKKYYAGIGSRETPADVFNKMKVIAYLLDTKGYTLRSGGAKGADLAFEEGAGCHKEIFRAGDATPEAIKMAAEFHPAWERCNDYARRLHGRNMMIVLGADLQTPVEFIICWTKDGKASGGTGQALRLAEKKGIRVYNLHSKEDQQALAAFLNQNKEN